MSAPQETLHVKDRRRFNTDGTLRDGAEPLETETPVPPPVESAPKKEAPVQKEAPAQPKGDNLEISFSNFMMSLAANVQINLGLIPHPATRRPQINLVGAKQTIDILGMLETKTKGNLSAEEEQMLKQVLFELRMQYVEVQNKVTAPPPQTKP